MKKNIFLVIILLVFLSTIYFNQPNKVREDYLQDEKFKPWRLGVAISHNFPARVEQAYGVNYREDWTSIMLPYGQLFDPLRFSLQSMKDRSYSGYTGDELLLHPIINLERAQRGPRYRALPDTLYIYWRVKNSYINYVTVVEITEKVKFAITRKYTHPGPRFKGERCYQTRFLVGLLPDGRAKLWLRGCGIYTYIGTYNPSKSAPEPFAEKAKNKPVPWDKVNKVWYDKKFDKMQTLDDVIKELAKERAVQ
ncbi:DUF2931 family protein [Vibrio ponticus]|uniref:DUF2931 family protein n=1 Tax=Vibrio ponticus TaxID=265668 RepID=UPI001607FF24|nr:DUF2931 family protein [Vibrio ponticus]